MPYHLKQVLSISVIRTSAITWLTAISPRTVGLRTRNSAKTLQTERIQFGCAERKSSEILREMLRLAKSIHTGRRWQTLPPPAYHWHHVTIRLRAMTAGICRIMPRCMDTARTMELDFAWKQWNIWRTARWAPTCKWCKRVCMPALMSTTDFCRGTRWWWQTSVCAHQEQTWKRIWHTTNCLDFIRRNQPQDRYITKCDVLKKFMSSALLIKRFAVPCICVKNANKKWKHNSLR